MLLHTLLHHSIWHITWQCHEAGLSKMSTWCIQNYGTLYDLLASTQLTHILKNTSEPSGTTLNSVTAELNAYNSQSFFSAHLLTMIQLNFTNMKTCLRAALPCNTDISLLYRHLHNLIKYSSWPNYNYWLILSDLMFTDLQYIVGIELFVESEDYWKFQIN